MRAVILYYLVQAQAAERHRHAQRDAPTRAASRARHPQHRPWAFVQAACGVLPGGKQRSWPRPRVRAARSQ